MTHSIFVFAHMNTQIYFIEGKKEPTKFCDGGGGGGGSSHQLYTSTRFCNFFQQLSELTAPI